jgi:large subunit ribosomal protein L5
MAARLKKIYKEKIVPELKAKLELKNTMQVPRILKITVNMGVGEAVATRRSWMPRPPTWRRSRVRSPR